MNAGFPYRDLMDHPAWAVIDAAIGELEGNDDVELTTARRYVVGLLVRRLVEAGLTFPMLRAVPEPANGSRFCCVARFDFVDVGSIKGKPSSRAKRAKATA